MIKTTVVGSYPVPGWLKLHPSPEAVQDAVRVILQIQHAAGIDVASDGELSRWNAREHRPSGMVDRFTSQMQGIVPEATAAQRIEYEARDDTKYRGRPPGVVVGEVAAGGMDLELEYQLSARLTQLPLKFTITSPYMMAKLLHDVYYRDFPKLLFTLADVLAEQVARLGAAVVQVDEPNLPGSPHDASLAAQAINRVLAGAQGETAVHLCFGNFGGQQVQRGDYGRLVAFFNELQCHHLVLETTRRATAELELLREIKTTMRLGLGVVDVKDLQVEEPSLIASRLDALAKLVGPERIGYVHPDCGLSHLPRDVADRKLSALTAGRDLYLGATPR
jgi:5-methyltetrahydropteroyltriglutamate--homocysteine methyltransferase